MKHAVARGRRENQSKLGQFFTSEPVADLMASMFDRLPRSVRLLDAGAGAGALTRAVVARCCNGTDGVRAIKATLYEVDPDVIPQLAAAMRECARLCEAARIAFDCTIQRADFIQEMSSNLANGLFGTKAPEFNIVIVNPPYRKIHTKSKERESIRSVGVETSNLYTAFLALILRLLSPDGQLVAITPRSFCNGPYFRPFREDLLQKTALRRIHVFDSRQAAFRADGVLQENIVFHAVRASHQSAEVRISSSSGEPCGDIAQSRVEFSEVVTPKDAERYIHVPSLKTHSAAKDALSGLHTKLPLLGLSVSTGRVVDFRLRESLRKDAEASTVPLIYPCHFNGGTVHWPKDRSRKPNAILDTPETRRWLVPAGLYVLVKRFTAKEERRRVVACIIDAREIKADWPGIENHLNYFNADGHGIDRKLALGLYAFLNSSVVDQYFRRFRSYPKTPLPT